jgi:hypothetical protein
MQRNQEASGNGSHLTDAVTARAGAHYGTLAAAEDENWVWGMLTQGARPSRAVRLCVRPMVRRRFLDPHCGPRFSCSWRPLSLYAARANRRGVGA